MVDFLIRRPIAVTMTFIAILVLGVVAINRIPVSLMPDIDIPEITVQVGASNRSAREVENGIVRTLRQHLMQVAHLDDIRSESKDGEAVIYLRFDYGTEIDFAFVEVNEKIDRAMGSLPREIDRPRVIKASVSDIPVYYLNLTLKKDLTTGKVDRNGLFPVSQRFIELSDFSDNVIRKRLEQLDEVALVDISGQVFSELLIMPDIKKLESLNISLNAFSSAIKRANVMLGNLSIRDGQYQYNIRFSNTLTNLRDFEELYLKVDNRLLKLGDLAQIVKHPQRRRGLVRSNGHDAITMAVIKQSDARMEELKENVTNLLNHFKHDYPHIEFSVTRDQTRLLDYSITNLGQTLMWGAVLAFLLMFLFLRDLKSPLLIGITIPTSLVVALLFFYAFGISINIISLSGLVLGVGMMIDNSIIVIDNITQHWDRARQSRDFKGSLQILWQACNNGTNEVFRPMLSSVLTTCAVFIPLIFIKGMAGALFFDQAMAITIGLLVSLVVSITLLPVYFVLLYKRSNSGRRELKWLKRINSIDYEGLYEKGFRLTMRNQGVSWLLFVLLLIGAGAIYTSLDKKQLPAVEQDEVIVSIDWNEKIHIDENRVRCEQMLAGIDSLLEQKTCLVGEQQFILVRQEESASSEVFIYLKTKRSSDLETAKRSVADYLAENYSNCRYEFAEAGNIFNSLFGDSEAPLCVRLRATSDFGNNYNTRLEHTVEKLRRDFAEQHTPRIRWQENKVLIARRDMLLAYDVNNSAVVEALKSAFNSNQIMLITQNNSFIPVILGRPSKTIGDIVQELKVRNNKGRQIPLRTLVSETTDKDLKQIVAGKEGEYYPIAYAVDEEHIDGLIKRVKNSLNKKRFFEANFTGSIFSNREMINQLMIILCVSLLLLYFILAAQFESLSLPLIVLLEVPMDIFGALLMLKLFGATINLMSLIGIIVMSGIIINDSILKIDTANQLRAQGYSLIRALATAGQRRLKPILMTSLTTILALLPFLFTSGLGADLQRPLALAVIGGMFLGTLVSLYFIPLCYYYLKREKRQAAN